VKLYFKKIAIVLLFSFVVIVLPGYQQPWVYGQASTPALQTPQPSPDLDQIKNLIRIPLVRQTMDYTCGVAALQSVLLCYGEEYGQLELARILGTDTHKGTSYRAILRFANRKFSNQRKRDFQMRKWCDMKIDDLRQVIDAGKPMIIFMQAWGNSGVNWKKEWKEGHYVVAIGYDEKNIYFMDPSTLGQYTYVPIEEFLDRWHDKDPSIGEKLIRCGLVIGNDSKKPVYDFRIIRRMD
jgi:predicted double-glycine peptidase